jgi:leucyl aminopeptidase (aminopeptidase T)
MHMTEVVTRRKIRHAHMVNISKQIMRDGMRADFREVDRISLQVIEIARAAALVRAKTPAGTDITAEMNPDYKWLKTSGIISQNTWGNLPGGEIFTTPGEVNGTFVVDGVVGDYLCAKYGDLQSEPLTIRIKGNRLTEAHCANRALEDEFWRYTHTDENSDRVGEFAIGTNIGVRDVIGNILQDEKIPGVHIAFGDPYGTYTGAPWRCSTHIDVVGRKFDIWADDRMIMRGGEFVLDRTGFSQGFE